MKTIKLSQAFRPLAEYAADLGDEIVVLTERNKPVAAIVPLKRVDRESLALSSHPEFLGIMARSRVEIRGGRTISLAAMKQVFPARRSPHAPLQPASRARHRATGAKRRSRPARG